MSAEMVKRIKETLAHPQDEPVWLDIPKDIGWIPCPVCSLPFSPGGKLIMDTRTGKGACSDCGEWGLAKLREGVAP